MRPRLRLFTGEEDLELCAPASVSMTFGELMRVLDHANRSQRAWLRDFDEDEIHVPEDLYDVLMEYWQMRPGA
ncbi:MAG: hypothetical protein KDA66_07675 [Planctomycetaceae bacterium]|nr:hypothetical protein [Planctomycetaceae bacterium]